MVYKWEVEQMKDELETKDLIYISSEAIAYSISNFLHQNNKKIITYDLVFSYVKQIVKDEKLVEQIYDEVRNLLINKYGINLVLEKKI